MSRTSTKRSLVAVVSMLGAGALVATALAPPAAAMPERYADAGTILWCEGESGYLEAGDTTQAAAYWGAALDTGTGVLAVAGDEVPLLDGGVLAGSAPAQDAETGDDLGTMSVAGSVERGATETLSGWDVDPDGRRYRSEGTRTPLTGTVTLSLDGASASLTCTGWELDLETFVLTRGPAADNVRGWVQDSFELPDGAGTVGFYGDRRTELGVALDLTEPYAFAGERLQVRNGRIEGTLALRDPDTFEVVGTAFVTGTLRRTGTERVVDTGPGYRWVTQLAHYDVDLTITTSTGKWSGTFAATHETLRTRVTIPPRALH